MNSVSSGPPLPLLLAIAALALIVFLVVYFRIDAARGARITAILMVVVLALVTVVTGVAGGFAILIAMMTGTYLFYYAVVFCVFLMLQGLPRSRYALGYWFFLLLPVIAYLIFGDVVVTFPVDGISIDMK